MTIEGGQLELKQLQGHRLVVDIASFLASSLTAAVPSCCAGRSASLDVELLVVDIKLSDTSEYEVGEMVPDPRHGRLGGAPLELFCVAPGRSGMFSWV